MANPIDYVGPLQGRMTFDNLTVLADVIEECIPDREDYAKLLRSDVCLNVNGKLPYDVSESDYASIKRRYPVPATYPYVGMTLSNPCAQWYTVVAGRSYLLLLHPEVFTQWPIHTIDILDCTDDTRILLNNTKVPYIRMIYPNLNTLQEMIVQTHYLPTIAAFSVFVSTNETIAQEVFNFLKVNLRVHKGCLLRVNYGTQTIEGEK